MKLTILIIQHECQSMEFVYSLPTSSVWFKCCLMTLGLSNGIWCHVRPWSFLQHDLYTCKNLMLQLIQWSHKGVFSNLDFSCVETATHQNSVSYFSHSEGSVVVSALSPSSPGVAAETIVLLTNWWEAKFPQYEHHKWLTLKVLHFWKFTYKLSGWISDSYCSLKPLWLGMGEVVPTCTSPTLHPPSPPTGL